MCSCYESNAHWKQINLHCFTFTLSACYPKFIMNVLLVNRWFEAGLKVNCIITGINVGVIYLCVIDCVRKLAIREEI